MAAKMTTKRLARCRVCHREMTDPAHIAAGIGPTCAQKALRAGTVAAARAAAPRVFYPRERYERIRRSAAKLAAMLTDSRYEWTEEERADITRWYARWSAMERRAYRLMTSGHA